LSEAADHLTAQITEGPEDHGVVLMISVAFVMKS